MENTKHTREFIEEMRIKLIEERDVIQSELGLISRKDAGDYQAIYPEYGRHEEENADEVADFQARAAATEAVEARLKNINAALARIDEGTYGVTQDGEVIPEKRLRANPAATTIIESGK